MIIQMTMDCHIFDVQSIKSKRSIIKSCIERAHHRYRVSIAEIDYHDLWQRALIEVALVTNDWIHGEKVMQKVLRLFETQGIEIIRFDIHQI